MLQSFKIICSSLAASTLSKEECRGIVRRVIPLARQRDRSVHEGLAFAFNSHGNEWQVVVDLAEGWIKIMGKDEFEKAMKEAIEGN